MKKFLLMAALVAVAAWLVDHRLLPLWKKDKPAEGATHAGPEGTPPASQEARHDPPPPPPLTDGLALVAQGKHAEAIPVLKREIEELEAKGSPDAARHVAALARSFAETDQKDKAAETWKGLLSKCPQSPERAEACYWLAQAAADPTERLRYLEQARGTAGDSDGKRLAEADHGLGLAREAGKEIEARTVLSRVLREGLPAEKAAEVRKAIGEINDKVLWSMVVTPPWSTSYKVASGDTLTKIARDHRTTVGLIMRVNRLRDTRIREGQDLKLVPCDGAELVVRKVEMTIQLWLKGCFIRESLVCVGDPLNAPTPEGTFTIGSRIENPPWKDIPTGDPRNILGTRWMGFKEKPSYGVHGTTQPETVPGAKSAGCVRMQNADVEVVYDFAIEGTKVTILP